MDAYTEKHLQAWIRNAVPYYLQESTEALMRRYIAEDEEVTQFGWPRVRDLAEQKFGLATEVA